MSTHFARIFWDHDKKKPAEQIVDTFLLDLYHAGYDPDLLDTKRPEYLEKVRAILKKSGLYPKPQKEGPLSSLVPGAKLHRVKQRTK